MDYQFLSQTMLFSGESPEEIKEMLSCLGAVTRSYGKGEIIYHAGECVHSMGLVLSGNVQIESDDVWGNRHGKICCFRAESSTPHQSQSAGGCSLICLRSLLPQTVLILQFRLTDSSSQTT